LTQNVSPNPPVANIEGLSATVHWRALLRLRLVGDFLIDRPRLYINLKNVRKEEESKVPLKEKGWQEALESIYPLKINVFTIHDGSLTYKDEGPYEPLHLTGVNFHASNIRNIRSPEHTYPSSLRLEGKIFGKGTLTLDGYANFLLEPHLGFKGDVELVDMDLGYFKPITNRGNISVDKGTLSAKGDLEYTPQSTVVNLKNLEIRGVHVDYLHLPPTAEVEKERVQKAAQTAKELSNAPTSKIRIRELKIKDSAFGYVNRTSNPNYRLFIDHAEATLKNFSNQFTEGQATLELKGKFMGMGETRVSGTFRPETNNPDFNLNVAIENTEMTAMSDLFRTFGSFDIKAGLFSFYSELTIKGDMVKGYVKPLFKDMKVSDQRTGSQKGFFHKLYIGIVNDASKLLENRPRGEVATKADISGPIASPKTSTLQIIINLVRNAFIKSILPGFEKEASQSGK
jgi:uncharacterized protein DUF748